MVIKNINCLNSKIHKSSLVRKEGRLCYAKLYGTKRHKELKIRDRKKLLFAHHLDTSIDVNKKKSKLYSVSPPPPPPNGTLNNRIVQAAKKECFLSLKVLLILANSYRITHGRDT